MTTALLERDPAVRPDPPLPRPLPEGHAFPCDRYLLVSEGDPAADAAAAWLYTSGLLGANAEVTLLYVFSLRGRSLFPFTDLPEWEPLDVAVAHESHAAFVRLAQRLNAPARRVRERVLVGDLAHAVLRACGEEPYKAVILGHEMPRGRFSFYRPDPVRLLLRCLPHPLIVVPTEAKVRAWVRDADRSGRQARAIPAGTAPGCPSR